eukprot:2572471-Lingulodinium_polyedra.AAC.1
MAPLTSFQTLWPGSKKRHTLSKMPKHRKMLGHQPSDPWSMGDLSCLEESGRGWLGNAEAGALATL